MALVCGVDSGTQSTKVEVRDVDTGRVVGSGRGAHPDTTPPRSEQDPHEWWRAFREAFAAAGEPKVDAVAVAGQQHGLVVLDAGGEVIRPAKLWNDTESAPQAEELVEALGADGWAKACGSVPVASFTITKLAWLKRWEPESLARMRRVLLPHDWFVFELCGRAATDRGDASGTGYWSPHDERWRLDLLELVDDSVQWDERLPEVLGPLDVAGEARAPGFGGAVVAPGTGDNMGAALGLGLRPGDVAISIGTSGTVYAVSEKATADESGAVAGFCDATGRYLPLVCTLNAAKVTEAFARLLGVDHTEFDRLALACEPGAGRVVLLPYLDGERTPNRPDATGMLAGVRSDVTREQIARAAVEGVVCGLLDGLDALRGAGVEVGGRVFLIGGGARSAAYRRVLADLLGRPLVVPSGAEQVAAGACVQAAAVLSGSSPSEIAESWGLAAGETVEPSQDVDAAAIREAYAALRG